MILTNLNNPWANVQVVVWPNKNVGNALVTALHVPIGNTYYRFIYSLLYIFASHFTIKHFTNKHINNFKMK